MNRPAELILVRHGETTGNSTVRLNGSTDVPLSDLGRRQMERVGCALADLALDELLTSPLVRARQSAQIVAGGRPLEARVVEGFREIDFGRWEGLTLQEVALRDPPGYEEWRRGHLDFTFPEGDNRIGFRDRVAAEARRRLVLDSGTWLAVLHKGVCKVIVGSLTGLPPAEWNSQPCELGSIHRLRLEADGWRLVSACEVSHLGEDRLAESR